MDRKKDQTMKKLLRIIVGEETETDASESVYE